MGIWQNVLAFFDSLHIPSFRMMDFVEIIIMTFLLYQFIKSIKNTRTYLLLKAFLILAFLYMIAELFAFSAIKLIFQSLAIIALFAVIVIFHPELRKLLEKMGAIGFDKFSIKELKDFLLKRKQKHEIRYSNKTIDELVNAAFSLGDAKTGALIVMEGNVPLNDYIATGIDLNADISAALLINIFEKNTPLHDGAVITVGNKIKAGTCYLPLSDNPKISKHLGTRHRAGIGISEIIDCFVIIVSEETGRVSYVHNGNITVCKSPETLKNKLESLQVKENFIHKKRKLTHNIYLKAISLVIAFFGWILIINNANPITTKTFYDVPIQIVNQEVITNINKTFTITSGSTVDVVVKDSRSIVDSLTIKDIVVTADMSKLSYVYSVPLSATAPNSSTEVKFLKENTLTVVLDEIVSKEFSLTLKKIGTPRQGIYVSKITSSVDGIVVTGAQSVIDTIDRVEFTVDISDAKQDFTKNVIPVIYNKNGEVLDSSLYKLNKETIEVTAELLNTKMVPVIIRAGETDPSKNYEISILSYNPTAIYIAGTEENLNEVYEIVIELKSDIDNDNIISGSFVKEINIENYLPEGIYCASQSNKIDVEILHNPYTTRKIEFNKFDIAIKNQTEDFNLQFRKDIYFIEVTGKTEVINKLKISDFAPYIDIKDLQEGLYNIKLILNPINGVKVEDNVSVDIELIPVE